MKQNWIIHYLGPWHGIYSRLYVQICVQDAAVRLTCLCWKLCVVLRGGLISEMILLPPTKPFPRASKGWYLTGFGQWLPTFQHSLVKIQGKKKISCIDNMRPGLTRLDFINIVNKNISLFLQSALHNTQLVQIHHLNFKLRDRTL